jgi:DNA-binding MarR family transcriptional regulator
LDVWRAVTVQAVRSDEPDLTTRQLAILMTITLGTPPHTVRGLSQTLKIAKPAVTRAVDALERHGLAVRMEDEDDARSVLIVRTARGQMFLATMAAAGAKRATEAAALLKSI